MKIAFKKFHFFVTKKSQVFIDFQCNLEITLDPATLYLAGTLILGLTTATEQLFVMRLRRDYTRYEK